MTGEVAALGWSVTANIGGDRQLVFQSHIAVDVDDKQINGLIDRAMRIIDRQQAAYDIRAYDKEMDDLRRDIDQGDAGIAEVEENFRKAHATFDVQLVELNRLINDVNEQAAANAAARGQSVKAALKGRPQSDIDRYTKAIEDIKKTKIEQEAEKAVALASFNSTQERRRNRVLELEKMRAEKQALIDGG